MGSTPQFIATSVIGSVNVSAANTNIDGTGTITTLVAGSANGTRIVEIDAQCAATSVAALVNVFLSLDSGATWKLFDQITIVAATPSTSVKATRNLATYANLVLPSSAAVLGVTTSVAQSTNVVALGGAL